MQASTVRPGQGGLESGEVRNTLEIVRAEEMVSTASATQKNGKRANESGLLAACRVVCVSLAIGVRCQLPSWPSACSPPTRVRTASTPGCRKRCTNLRRSFRRPGTMSNPQCLGSIVRWRRYRPGPVREDGDAEGAGHGCREGRVHHRLDVPEGMGGYRKAGGKVEGKEKVDSEDGGQGRKAGGPADGTGRTGCFRLGAGNLGRHRNE